MDSDRPPDTPQPPSPEALFRYQIVAQALADELGGRTRAKAVGSVAARRHLEADGSLRKASRRTVYRWLAAYEAFGLVGLEPKPRTRTEASVVLPDDFVRFLKAVKDKDAKASIPEVIRQAYETGVLRPTDVVHRATVWRAAHRLGLPLTRRSSKRDRDVRRFRWPHRMQLVLCDGKRFRAGVARARRVALFFLDNATRCGLQAVVGTTETTELFLTGLDRLLRRHGVMDAIYLDQGSGFWSLDSVAVIAQLEMGHIPGEVAYPEGHGMIERFHLTAWTSVLRGYDRNPAIDPDCGSLTLRLQHFLDHQYNQRPHSSLGNDTPQARWDADPRQLRFPWSDAELRERFRVTETRTVSSDNVISYCSTPYEVPRGHAETVIQVHREVLTGRLFVVHDGRLVRLFPVDLSENATAGRARPARDNDEPHSPVSTAASMSYDRDFGPVVDPDGGFTDPDPED